MRIFVTGGTGFIGKHLVARLKETPHELRCLARETSRSEVLEKAGAEVIRGDVLDRQSLVEGMRGCDWVAHLANFYEFWTPNKRVYREVNVTGTRNVMEAALAAGVSKVVHVSTAGIFLGAPSPVTESSPLGIECPGDYVKSKREGERLVWELYEEKKLPLVGIYPGGVFGPGDPKASARYVENLVKGRMPAQVFPDSAFPWVHVRDVAEAVARALEKEDNIGEKYLVVSENLTFREVNAIVAEFSGKKAPRLSLPDWFSMAGAYLATGLAEITRKPPILDMAVEQMRLMKLGMRADGSKSARELGVSYMPVRDILKEQVELLARGTRPL